MEKGQVTVWSDLAAAAAVPQIRIYLKCITTLSSKGVWYCQRLIVFLAWLHGLRSGPWKWSGVTQGSFHQPWHKQYCFRVLVAKYDADILCVKHPVALERDDPNGNNLGMVTISFDLLRTNLINTSCYSVISNYSFHVKSVLVWNI